MFQRLRWLTIPLFALVVGAVELLSDTALDGALPFPWNTMFNIATVVLIGLVFSTLVFRRIDSLADQLAARSSELERRNATVRALHRVSLAVTATVELDRILQAVADQARVLLHADGAVLLLDHGAGGLVVGASSGDAALIRSIRHGGAHGDVPLLDDSTAISRLDSPLQRAGETIGSLIIGSRAERAYGADEVEILSSLASQAAMAVANARLQDRLRELAVVAERERIAREMHDGLAQVLGYVNTKSLAAEHLLDDGRVADARLQIRQLATAARSIYVDVREAILGLRSVIEPGVGLMPAVETYVARWAEASKLAVQVRASDEARAVALPLSIEDQVFRILQESLTNVRKHAEAGRALVEFDVHGGAFVLQVTDDGRGMTAPADVPNDWPHYGLAAMRERTASIGGSIEWTAVADGGTVVRLAVPLAAVPEAPAAAGRSGA